MSDVGLNLRGEVEKIREDYNGDSYVGDPEAEEIITKLLAQITEMEAGFKELITHYMISTDILRRQLQKFGVMPGVDYSYVDARVKKMKEADSNGHCLKCDKPLPASNLDTCNCFL